MITCVRCEEMFIHTELIGEDSVEVETDIEYCPDCYDNWVDEELFQKEILK